MSRLTPAAVDSHRTRRQSEQSDRKNLKDLNNIEERNIRDQKCIEYWENLIS